MSKKDLPLDHYVYFVVRGKRIPTIKEGKRWIQRHTVYASYMLQRILIDSMCFLLRASAFTGLPETPSMKRWSCVSQNCCLQKPHCLLLTYSLFGNKFLPRLQANNYDYIIEWFQINYMTKIKQSTKKNVQGLTLVSLFYATLAQAPGSSCLL